MKSLFKHLLIIGLTLTLFGCITKYSPTQSVVTLNNGETKVFTAFSDIPIAKLEWILDGRKVSYGTNQFNYVAENNGPQIAKHILFVKEAGLPLIKPDSVTWTIIVLPGNPVPTPTPTPEPTPTPTPEPTPTPTPGPTATPTPAPTTPAIPGNVQATDLNAGLTNIDITWNASEGADYYEVYRAIFDVNQPYERVGENIPATSFTYVQTWQEDVYAIIGDTPGLAANANDSAKLTFINALNDYREMALPTLFNFKAPAFFKVRACNAGGCSELSTADAGRANYIHTAQFSEVAQHVIPTWGYAQLIALADAPSGANGLSWCGIDLCGAGGGLAMGRVQYVAGEGVMVDVVYEDFTEALDGVPGAYALVDGSLGGANELLAAQRGELFIRGDFTLDMAGIPMQLSMYAHIGGTSGSPSEGYANITYNGATYQFTLPIQPIDGVSGHAAAPPSPIIPARTDTGDWRASSGPYPVPLSVQAPGSRCRRNWTTYTIPECPVSIAP